jgi:hypothetical protein
MIVSLYYLFIQFNPSKKINCKNIFDAIKTQTKLSGYDLIAIFLAVLYPVFTIFSVKAIGPKSSLLATKVFENGWMNLLFGYKFIGFAYHVLFGGGYFSSFNNFGFFEKLLLSPSKYNVFLLIVAVLVLLLTAWVIKWYIKNRPRVSKWIPLLIFILINYFFLAKDVVDLHFLTLFYITLALVLLHFIRKRGQNWNPHFSHQILILFLLGLLFQYVGMDFGIREPVLYIIYDVLSWGLLGLFIFLSIERKTVLYFVLLLSVILPIFFNIRISGMLRMSEIDRHFMKMDVTSLLDKSAKRENFVDGNNMAKFYFEDSNMEDVYSSILGANLYYSGKNVNFLNNSFIRK